MKFLLFLFFTLFSLKSVAQKTFNYHPDGHEVICVNGTNRYTRALYGPQSEYRIETSDRPVFALYKNKNYRNVRFLLDNIPLDSVQYCEARYSCGRRDYLLRDSRWGKDAQLYIQCLPNSKQDGAFWFFEIQGFTHSSATLQSIISPIANPKLKRNGDIGVEKEGSFESDGTIESQLSTSFDHTLLLKTSPATNTHHIQKVLEGTNEFEESKEYFMHRSSLVAFSTPDPYLNPIGGAMVLAADGAWDGKVWNHGAVGWHSQLPGWRGAYMGDFLGMPDRQRTHFTAYAKSQVTDVPVTKPHLMDSTNNLARGTYEWGTPMYSDGYICRRPEKNHEFHHYDMNLVYIDELLWHFQFDADTAYMREMWPVITRHLAWERQAWDPDHDHLYDAYCCIWASDALGYNSGAVTHSSAYNYRANLLAARIAEIIGEDATPYRAEAEAILRAMDERLWISHKGHWAEYQDFMGERRLHESPAVWSIYTPVDCGACTPEQAYSATQYVDHHIPHLQVVDSLYTISSSNWSPYEWSVNNVAMAEVLHTILAYYQAGRADEAYRLLRGTVMDYMYSGQSPANFGQLSSLDPSTGEEYRDFADVVGIASRTFIQGLYGITPEALEGRLIIRPGFPSSWHEASIRTPYIQYAYVRKDGRDHFHVKQTFPNPLKVVIRQNLGNGKYRDTEFTDAVEQDISVPTIVNSEPFTPYICEESLGAPQGTAFDDIQSKRCRTVDISAEFNASVTDIFRNRYLTPRSPYTTLCVPTQGVGDWCSTKRMVEIDDSVFRSLAKGGHFNALGIDFLTPQQGDNIAFVSLWDNYPDSITFPLRGKASHAYLMMAGSTNPMQSRIMNGEVIAVYTDGTQDSLPLVNPDNWCPIEQDYNHTSPAFPIRKPYPYRIDFATGTVSRTLPESSPLNRQSSILLDFPLNPHKSLHHLVLKAHSNEVVIGLMSIVLQK